MNVLSLFDGMSCGQIALNRIGLKPNKYYAAEIDKYAIKVTQANYPDTIQLGDVTKWREWNIDWPSIDLVTGGFPCQAWSMAGKQLGDKDERGALFWTTLDIMIEVLKHNLSAKFLLENVKMKKEFEQYITHHTEQALGKVNKHLINSALVSAQNRQRYYWTNIEGVEQPEDKGITPLDIIQHEEKTRNSDGWQKWWRKNSQYQLSKKYSCIINDAKKSVTMTARQVASWNGNLVMTDNGLRFITPVEAERLQTAPDNYTAHVSNNQRYKMLGNGWTVDVIAHILKGLKDV